MTFLCLYCLVGIIEKDPTEQYIAIENYTEKAIIYRIRVSMANVLILQAPTGIIEPQHSVETPISLKKNLPAECAHMNDVTVKLAVEFAEYSSEYEICGSKAFWSEKGSDAIRKSIFCRLQKEEVRKPSIHALSSNKLDAFEQNERSYAGAGKSGADLIHLSSECLKFVQNQYQCENTLVIHNPSSTAVAYRVKPAVMEEYIVARGTGVLMPGLTANISVVLVSIPPPSSVEDIITPHKSDLLVEFLDVDDDYSDKIAKSVWASSVTRIIRRDIGCVAYRSESCSAALVSFSPDSLKFSGNVLYVFLMAI